MNAFFDSTIIAKLYTQESNSIKAASLVSHYSPPYIMTRFQELEVRNAIRLKCFRNEITDSELLQALSELDDDLRRGLWSRVDLIDADVFLKAKELSATFSVKLGSRSLDILHVAAAVLLQVVEFATFDRRQGNLARAAGLAVKP